MQLTGRTNYENFAREIGKDLDEAVAYCETPDGAVESACFFWRHHGLNAISDAVMFYMLLKLSTVAH